MKIDKTDTNTWKKMGLELCALNALLCKISCDVDYQNIMTKKIYDNRFYKIIKLLNQIRSEAEDRMCLLEIDGGDIDVFYPRTNQEISDWMDKTVSEYRDKFNVEE